MFPEDPKDPELGERAEELLSHWPLGGKSPAEWEDLATRIDARIQSTEVGSTPDYLLEAPVLEEQDVLRRSHPRMKRPSQGSLAALAKASVAQEVSTDAEREALARSLLALAVKARTETRGAAVLTADNDDAENRNDTDSSGAASSTVGTVSNSSASLSSLVNGPSMQFLAARQVTPAAHVESLAQAEGGAEGNAEPGVNATAPASAKGSRERGSMWFGIAFGLLGMAAAGVMYVASARDTALAEAPAPSARGMAANAKAEAAEAKTEPPALEQPAGAPAARAVVADLLNVEEVPVAEAVPTPAVAQLKDRTAPARPGSGVRVPAAAPAPPSTAPDGLEPARVTPPVGPSEPGMVMADSQGALPDHPSTGAVQAAVGTVLGAARACVAGQNAASRATIHFASDGSVQSVAVAGPALATSAEPCLRNALSGARVQPFARPAYSVTLTVRPQ